MAFGGTNYKLAYGILAAAILGMVIFLALNAKKPAMEPQTTPTTTNTYEPGQ